MQIILNKLNEILAYVKGHDPSSYMTIKEVSDFLKRCLPCELLYFNLPSEHALRTDDLDMLLYFTTPLISR